MLGCKAVWELCQASLIAMHPQKSSVGSSWEGRWKSHSQGLREQRFREKPGLLFHHHLDAHSDQWYQLKPRAATHFNKSGIRKITTRHLPSRDKLRHPKPVCHPIRQHQPPLTLHHPRCLWKLKSHSFAVQLVLGHIRYPARIRWQHQTE